MTNLNQLNFFSVREGFWGISHFYIEAQKTTIATAKRKLFSLRKNYSLYLDDKLLAVGEKRIVTIGQDIDIIDANGNRHFIKEKVISFTRKYEIYSSDDQLIGIAKKNLLGTKITVTDTDQTKTVAELSKDFPRVRAYIPLISLFLKDRWNITNYNPENIPNHVLIMMAMFETRAGYSNNRTKNRK